jgi:glycosyltransferase involved in cell wall biosynthesis
MLYDKGVVEFVEAAKIIKQKVEHKAEFLLVGDCDTENLAGIPEKEIQKIIDEPYLKWIGFQKDIFSILKEADIVVLPSYREGLPKSLIEACAVGRPIITTDTQGCRECVINDYNGYLVPVKDTEILAQKMKLLINDANKRTEMGKNSRLLADQEFSISKVIENHLAIYNSLSKQ